jgi:general secretion pathway protein B
MSYILDALRKSDAQRRLGTPPALVTPQPAAIAPVRSRTLPYGLLAAVLLAAGIVIGAWRPWQAEERPVVAADTAAVKPAAPVQSAPLAPPAPPVAPAPAPLAKPAQVREQPRKAVAAIPKKAAAPAAPAVEVVPFSDLPISVQQEIPPLSITAHAFSPIVRDRLIGINDRVLREGEQVTPSLLLEQITPDGMIMSYKGYRFRRGVR